jgi:hypothetical protein
MTIPGFTAESAVYQNRDYRMAAARPESAGQTVKAQLNCAGCTDYCTQECEGLPTHALGRCFFACRSRCCRGIRD